jgi:FdhD protein
MNPYITKKVIKKRGISFGEKEDYIAVEKKLEVTINGKEIISLYCTPLMIEELVIGLFLTEGILSNKISLERIKIAYG